MYCPSFIMLHRTEVDRHKNRRIPRILDKLLSRTIVSVSAVQSCFWDVKLMLPTQEIRPNARTRGSFVCAMCHGHCVPSGHVHFCLVCFPASSLDFVNNWHDCTPVHL